MIGGIVLPGPWRANTTPHPPEVARPTPYDLGWDGRFCMFIYTAQTLLDMPVVPTFKREQHV